MPDVQQADLIEFVSPQALKPHPLNVAIYGDDDYHELVDSIKELGVLQALYVTSKNVILSGHRRWRAAMAAGSPNIPVIRMSYTNDLDERQAIIEHNRYRIKNGQQLWNEGQELKAIEQEKARQRQATSGPGVYGGEPLVEIFPQAVQSKTRDIVAKSIGLGSGRQWDKLDYVAQHKPTLLKDIKPDGITLSRAYMDTRREVRRTTEEREPRQFPQGTYQVLYADPPWQYGNSGLAGSAEDHYATMSIDDLKALEDPATRKVTDLIGDSCVLFLWVTAPFVPEALELCKAWGFAYKTHFVWIKDRATYGKLGFYLRSQHELLFVATRGSCLPKEGSLEPSLIYADKGQHSAKPEVTYTIIEKMYDGPYIELFARQRRPQWEAWGTL